ncbi:MAG: sodium:proton antiporter, partial [Cyclobacteriaceae bacterium]
MILRSWITILLFCTVSITTTQLLFAENHALDSVAVETQSIQSDAPVLTVDTHDQHELLDPSSLSVIPFVLLLLMIATGPLFFEHFWHKNYPIIAILLGLAVILYYLIFLHNVDHPIHALAEYIQFIALLSSLYIAAGGILINVDKEGKPGVNVMILLIGAVLANVIGTTGASMLLIRPFIRVNKNRIKPYHVVFFIFMVSNIGGSLT